MLNYVAKQPDSARAFVFENINSAGSFGLLSTYASVSGRLGKFQYLAYYSKRVSNGYRDNSESDYDAQSVMLIYDPGKRVRLTAELSRSNYVYHIPGALTDSMFRANPRQTTRSRNYFNPEIWVPSFRIDWQLGARTKMEWTTSAVLGYRNSVMFDRPANIADTTDPVTLTYANRQVDIDNFNSYTTELRLLHSYLLFDLESSLAVGVQYFNNDLHRQQLGKGTTGTDFDLTRVDESWGRDMHFKTGNTALFVENKFQVLPALSITPGVRVETGESAMSGTINYYDQDDVPNSIKHQFPLLGISAEYKLNGNRHFYGGWSQAYRPVIFKDIIPASVYEKVDKNLKDAYGYNLEAGFRGSSALWIWDVGVFRVKYNHRLGTQALTDENGFFYLYRTNIGNSVTDGAEVFVERNFRIGKNIRFSVFTSTAWFDGRYTSAQVRSGNENVDVTGNKIESVPDAITRNGITVKWPAASISFLYSYTGKTFADALNTETPSANGAVGAVPAYGLFDINSSFRLMQRLMIRVNINNVMNKSYFTKRPAFYPGPGIWPSDGRSVSVSAGIKI
jgi:Fe(3+) dicitrate transport protein